MLNRMKCADFAATLMVVRVTAPITSSGKLFPPSLEAVQPAAAFLESLMHPTIDVWSSYIVERKSAGIVPHMRVVQRFKYTRRWQSMIRLSVVLLAHDQLCKKQNIEVVLLGSCSTRYLRRVAVGLVVSLLFLHPSPRSPPPPPFPQCYPDSNTTAWGRGWP